MTSSCDVGLKSITNLGHAYLTYLLIPRSAANETYSTPPDLLSNMAPAVTIDTSSDFTPTSLRPGKPTIASRTLLLAPPSISSHPEALDRVFEAHDRNATDIQMLDRLALGLVSLPDSTYDVILMLSDADGTRTESQRLINRDIMMRIMQALKIGGKLKSQDGLIGIVNSPEKTEAILVGLVSDGSDGMLKQDTAHESVPLKIGKKKANGAVALVNNAEAENTQSTKTASNGKHAQESEPASKLAGVGFVDDGFDFDDDFDGPDELIDEDSLLTEEDYKRPIYQRKLLSMLILHGPWLTKALLQRNAGRRQERSDEPARTALAV